MSSPQEVLEAAAHGSELESSSWPDALELLLVKLDYIVHNNFPVPVVEISIPQNEFASSSKEQPLNQAAHSSTKALQKTKTGSANDKSVADKAISSQGSQAIIPDSQPSDSSQVDNIPPQLQALYSSIRLALTTSFSTAPPFTIQRLSELALRPSLHYRTLPSFLRALDRTVSVSSTADAFPLPILLAPEGDGNVHNILTLAAGRSLSDDFNGAALTRIPWVRESTSMIIGSDRTLTSDLRTESTAVIDGPNGAGSIETVTVTVNGITNNGPTSLNNSLESIRETDRLNQASNHEANLNVEINEDAVHVRGPENIGIEDMGPQRVEREGHVFDAGIALGRPGEAEPVTSETNSGAASNKIAQSG